MKLDPKELPDKLIKRMSPKVREILKLKTADEAALSQQIELEKELQRLIGQWLNRRQIEYINPPMHKRSQLPEHWPDFTFSVNNKSFAIEAKIPPNKPNKGQLDMHERLSAYPNGWSVYVVYNLVDFIGVMRKNNVA